MRPTFVQLVVGFALGAAVVASLALPGKFVIAKQPAMGQIAIPRASSPVVVEAAPIPRARVHPPRPVAPALPAEPAVVPPPVARPLPITRARPSPKPHEHRVRPSQPGPVADESLSIGVSSAEPEKTKKHERAKKQKAWKPSPDGEKTKKPKKAKKAKGEERPKASPRPRETKKPKKTKTEKPDRREDANSKDERDKENRAAEKKAGPKGK